jgi:hypothetical protein
MEVEKGRKAVVREDQKLNGVKLLVDERPELQRNTQTTSLFQDESSRKRRSKKEYRNNSKQKSATLCKCRAFLHYPKEEVKTTSIFLRSYDTLKVWIIKKI